VHLKENQQTQIKFISRLKFFYA